MANLKRLASIVSELRTERTNLIIQLQHVDAALSALVNLNGEGSVTKRGLTTSASRRRISAVPKARWAKSNANAPVATAQPKRTLSRAARKKIADSQRARWAKLKSQQKKAA
jgi:hypothetical protein